jgi:hypothetical protein
MEETELPVSIFFIMLLHHCKAVQLTRPFTNFSVNLCRAEECKPCLDRNGPRRQCKSTCWEARTIDFMVLKYGAQLLCLEELSNFIKLCVTDPFNWRPIRFFLNISDWLLHYVLHTEFVK